MLARDLSYAMLGKFVQCWCGSCSNRLLSNINQFQIKIAEKRCCSDDNEFSEFNELPEFSCLSLLGITQGFYLCNVVSRVLRQTTVERISPIQCCLNLSDNIAQGFYMCNAVPRLLRQHWTGFFHVHRCLEPQGNHCIGYLPVQLLVQCWPRAQRHIFAGK